MDEQTDEQREGRNMGLRELDNNPFSLILFKIKISFSSQFFDIVCEGTLFH